MERRRKSIDASNLRFERAVAVVGADTPLATWRAQLGDALRATNAIEDNNAYPKGVRRAARQAGGAIEILIEAIGGTVPDDIATDTLRSIARMAVTLSRHTAYQGVAMALWSVVNPWIPVAG